ncbi:hypothetical protein P885DRAFT_60598 [Corynascus similis CBS 632.67]
MHCHPAEPGSLPLLLLLPLLLQMAVRLGKGTGFARSWSANRVPHIVTPPGNTHFDPVPGRTPAVCFRESPTGMMLEWLSVDLAGAFALLPRHQFLLQQTPSTLNFKVARPGQHMDYVHAFRGHYACLRLSALKAKLPSACSVREQPLSPKAPRGPRKIAQRVRKINGLSSLGVRFSLANRTYQAIMCLDARMIQFVWPRTARV